MAWTIEYSDTALKKLEKLDRKSARAIADYMDERIAPCDNPRDFGKALTGSLKGRWRFRVGDYRVICSIREERLIVLVIDLGHRREIYR
ncbi:type II toxin-antitoxin system RelE family toxin [Xaviernesmea oryzae]|uniref:mRNA interferase RelE/StbE n=1 Tax=Xaviernesmea oryzae TaxID=464029 RepID=A0A1X7F7Z4_9HYPH|nr:type II toxin-antitoxin system RelE/ParE family toxin [Xaviernesmea oryzae]SMF47559.1 mRNA interferase RelE/StbE [Xaviernesmea oryzae]